MLRFKSKKITLPLTICLLAALLTPALAQAELGGSGGKAARDAAEQRAVREEKIEKRKQEAEAKKAAESQQAQPVEAQTPTEGTQERPAAQ